MSEWAYFYIMRISQKPIRYMHVTLVPPLKNFLVMWIIFFNEKSRKNQYDIKTKSGII